MAGMTTLCFKTAAFIRRCDMYVARCIGQREWQNAVVVRLFSADPASSKAAASKSSEL